MPKKGEVDATLKTESGIYKSLKRTQAKYERRFKKVIIRVPEGWGDQITRYVEQSSEYSSVNDMLCKLIKEEVGIDD